MLPLLALLTAAPDARAADLTWEGYYRARLLAFDSLSLSDTNALAEGAAAGVDHRARLAPQWTLSERAQLHAQLDLLAYQDFGGIADTWTDPVGGATIPLARADGVAPSAASLQATRVWADVYSGVGRFSFGRMPLQWGAGLYWNPGNDALAEYGDTSDRVSFTTRAGPMFVMGSVDWIHEGQVNEPDDMVGFSAAVGSRSETSGIGLLNHVRRQTANDWTSYTGDFWAYAEMGALRAETEILGTWGSGNLDNGANDVTVSGLGGMVDLRYRAGKLTFGAESGFATGDADPNDNALHTFALDRDHDVAILMFEEPMPTLQLGATSGEEGGRTTEAAVIGEGVSNAIYVKPRVGFTLLEGLDLEASALWATMAKGPASTEGRTGYGTEIDLGFVYDPYAHVRLEGTGALYLPGAALTTHEDADLGEGFDQSALGGRVVATVSF